MFKVFNYSKTNSHVNYNVVLHVRILGATQRQLLIKNEHI